MSTKKQKAVALRYPEWADAPYIAASAQGRAAERLIRVAQTNGVPVVRDELTVDVLSIQRVGDFIPEDTYTVIAGIFAFVALMEKQADERTV